MRFKNILRRVLKLIAKSNISSTSTTLSYQPTMPESLQEEK
ncbi:cyclic lactone autoinducer peptide [Halanaerobaculum tunisiense]